MKAIFISTIVFSSLALANYESGNIYDATNGKKIALASIINQLEPGTVVLLGERHDVKAHQAKQREFLIQAMQARFTISLGMEFFNYLQQPLVDQYTTNELPEEDFLKAIKWSGFPFANYRFQVRLPYYTGGKTIALNTPRALTSRISQVGITGLTKEEAALLPPDFVMGNELYFERFKAAVGNHGDLDPDTIWRYFQSQSVWDETMAWQTQMAMHKNPDHIFIIIVGDFHLQYGGGLPDRLAKRGIENILNISQVVIRSMNTDEIKKAIEPHPVYGPRADYVWVSE